MFLNIEEEKILKEKKKLLEEDERKNKFLYELMINGESDNHEFIKVAGKYTKLKYSNLTLTALIKDLKALNKCYKNKNVFGMSIFEENTYNQVKQLHKTIRSDVEYLCANINELDDFRKYHEKVLDALLYMSDINFSIICNVTKVSLNSDMLNEVLEFKDYADILWTSFKEDWDYTTFMRKISIYHEYNSLLYSALMYHANQKNEEEDKYLEENPAHIIEHNPHILKDDLFDGKTLLEAKKVMYEHAKQAKNIEMEEQTLNAIKETNLVLKLK